MSPVSSRLRTAVDAAVQAGRFLVRAQKKLRPSDVQTKSKNNFVTWVDREAEFLIRRLIRRRFPEDAVLGEESGETGRGNTRWIIDPLDGTTNYIRGVPFYCVSIAVADASGLRIGVIHDPARRETFSAEAGRGAALNGRPMRVSKARRLSSASVGTGIPYRSLHARWRSYETILRALARRHADTRRTGSMALDLAYVACGRLDALWAFDQAPWDAAAGAVLVREAGGRARTGADDPRRLASGDLLAANRPLYAALTRILSKTFR